MKKQVVVLTLKYGVGLGLLVWMVWSHWSQKTDAGVEVGIVGILDRPLQAGFLLLGALICITCVLGTFVRWFFLVRAQEIPFSVPNALRLGLVGYFYNTFLPGSVGGDLIKAVFIAREQSRRTVAVATVLVDRVVGLCGLVWLTALLGGYFWATGMIPVMASTEQAVVLLESIVTAALTITAGSLVFWFVLGLLSEGRSVTLAGRLERVPRVGHALAELWRAVWLYRRRPGTIVLTLGMSMATHTGFVLTFYCAARGLFHATEVPSFAAHYQIIPVGALIKGLPLAPGGIGVGEWGYGTLYDLLGFSFAAGVLASLAQRIVEWSWGLAGYLVYLRMRPALVASTASSDPLDSKHKLIAMSEPEA